MACSLSVEGAEAIADIVKRANLKELNLYMNDIGDAGILKVLSSPNQLCTGLKVLAALLKPLPALSVRYTLLCQWLCMTVSAGQHSPVRESTSALDDPEPSC